MQNPERGGVIRLIALGVVAVLEGLAILSVILHSALFPAGSIYPNIVSVAVFVLPVLVGLLSQRLEVAVLLALVPFFALVVVYLAIFALPWTVDLFTLGVLAGRVAGLTFLLGALGTFGWLVRRILPGQVTVALRQPAAVARS